MQPSINALKQQVWNLKTAPKIKTFLWRALSGALPVVDKLTKRGMKLDNRYMFCGQEGESINHVFSSTKLLDKFGPYLISPTQEMDLTRNLSMRTSIRFYHMVNRLQSHWRLEELSLGSYGSSGRTKMHSVLKGKGVLPWTLSKKSEVIPHTGS